MFDPLDDTIVAISSPPGASVRGIIRLSGPAAFSLATTVFRYGDDSSLVEAQGHRRLRGSVRLDAECTVPAEAYTFRAPASYTRQDVVELHTIGSPPVLAMVFDALTTRGARPAEPGEFTARAYFAGAMDLTCVEGVAAMIHAHNDSQLRASEQLMHGKLSRRSTQLRDELADLLALLEAEIDFAEESIRFVGPERLVATIGHVVAELEWLLAQSESVERLEVLPEVILVGPPNAGKSTLFNRLTGMDRAIQSATAGTTRDVLRAPVGVPGGEFMLLDTAGLRVSAPVQDDGERLSHKDISDVGRLAEAQTHRFLASADLVLVVLDVTVETCPLVRSVASLRQTLSGKTFRIIGNKMDALAADQLSGVLSLLGSEDEVCAVSAVTGEGVSALRCGLGKTLFSGVSTHGAALLALSNRQRHALRDACDALTRARGLMDETMQWEACTEVLALEIREAMNALSMLVGEVATEELLDRIFARFCIGK